MTGRLFAVALVLAPAVALADAPRTGAAAFGDWSSDRPGVQRLIRPGDLPAPYATESVATQPEIVAPPANRLPSVPAGFTVERVAEGLKSPRVLRTAPNGDIFVAESRAGQISVLPADGGAPVVFASGLNRPYGIAFYPSGDQPEFVYVGETDKIVRFPYAVGDRKAGGKAEVIVGGLPAGSHWTRDIAFSPDGGTLFIAIGSASNAGERMGQRSPKEIADWERQHGLGAAWGPETGRAAVLAADPDGGNLRTFATGIRNCSGLAIEPTAGSLWCATNERDGLGDNLPPDYATSVQEGRFYGWPWFYIGSNPDPRQDGARPDLKDHVTVPDVLIQPHSAPLGMTFYEGDAFPADYKGDGFVALHGSWNRGKPTGYKVVRLLMEDGKPTGVYEDFMTGFVVSDETLWGRPVGVTTGKDGSLYVSEDANGTIWRVRKAK